jgi:hypothetical protein
MISLSPLKLKGEETLERGLSPSPNNSPSPIKKGKKP